MSLAGGSDSASWATRAEEPLVPGINLPAVKKDVARDLREIQRATDEISKLRKKGGRDMGPRLLSLSADTRERARKTSQTIRRAFAGCEEGSSEHSALTALSEDFKATLRRFQLEAESAAPRPAATAQAPSDGSLAMSGHATSAMEEGAGRSGQTVAELQAVAANEELIAERDQGIAHLSRSVNEVAEIYQDLAVLVEEQGTHIDNIQTNIEDAAKQTHRGVRELAQANRSQRRARSRLCCFAVLLLFIVVVLVLVLHFALHIP